LTFVIPTHSRPNTIEKCLRSIAEQIHTNNVAIRVIDDQSPVETVEILERLVGEFAFLSHRRMEIHGDYSTAFREMFCEARGSEWVWTFGDDDILLPGALDFILQELVDKPSDLQFVHVAETRRAAGTRSVHRGQLIDLCNTIGWIELTGFITGNITRGERLWHAAQTPRWNRYAKSSFVQSAALLEELRYDQCAFYDFPLIVPQRDGEFPEDTSTKWREQNIDLRYQFAAECIEAMFEDGILTNFITPKFFRYLSYDLPGRFLSHFGADYINRGIVYDDMTWARIQKLGLFLSDKEYAQKLNDDCRVMRDLTILHSSLKANLDSIVARIAEISERRNKFPYPYTFVGQPEAAADTVEHHPV
jgi:hypothetical protein